ncbi:MAG: hypothetical protein KDB07_10190, partial [Planctomycetes bacterium]|nr:hypothetical protein [Planctomycetota bacterium]
VSNPPYIDWAERDELMPEVGRFEPPEALFADTGGLAAYHAILADAPDWLKHGGVIALEVGAGQAEAVMKIALQAGLTEVTSRADTLGHQRVVVAKKAIE